MENDQITLRFARVEDAKELLEIYKPYVEKTAITFEYEVPSESDFKTRIQKTLRKYPYIVALNEGKIIGYAYASSFKNRQAYDWSVETSIYLSEDARGKGLGTILYNALELILKKQGIININACITAPKPKSNYITDASIKFHEKRGYKLVAHFHNSGFKFDEWYDMVWMEKFINDHMVPPKSVKWFSEFDFSKLLKNNFTS